jgi:hypothetical protein
MFKSKKFRVFLLGTVMVFLTQTLGLDEATAASIVDAVVKITGGYLVGQGMADHGKGKEEAKTLASAKPEPKA